ncbi:MAG: thiamine ABC transporter substrate-binding protein, partial [Gammaproteobacteria bacterium]
PELSKQFLQFLISEEAQKILPVTNWMLPVVDVELPEVFDTLVQPEKVGFTPEEIAGQRKSWIKDWRSAATK